MEIEISLKVSKKQLKLIRDAIQSTYYGEYSYSFFKNEEYTSDDAGDMINSLNNILG